MTDNNDNIFFSRNSVCTQDGKPITTLPRTIAMAKGNTHYIIRVGEESSEFYCCENMREMTKKELDCVLIEYKSFAKQIHGESISDGHFLISTLPEKLEQQYQCTIPDNLEDIK